MTLQNTDVRIDDPWERDVLARFPSGGCDSEFLQLTAADGNSLLAEVEPPAGGLWDEPEVWDEEADDFLPAPGRFVVRYHEARTGKRYRLRAAVSREEAVQLFLQFLSDEAVKPRRGRWVEEKGRRRGRA
jgi:hypothetical protein